MKYTEMSIDELNEVHAGLLKEYEDYKALGLKLDMSRGKPSPAQLDISNDMLDVFNSESSLVTESGIDCRNYGNLEGIPEARKLMGDFLGVPAENVYVCGNASLNIMYDCVANSMLFGVMGTTPWCKLNTKVKFLCPVPGYDRHFKITELLGIEMINIPMTENGPDMDKVEKLVSSDSSIKGMWCVPKYSNPQGVVYSDETVKRLAALKPAAKDFRIYWDNAYALHYIYDESIEIPEILSECEKAGNPDMVYEFCSTSKISYAGGGISAIATSKANLEWIQKRLTIQTISYDKINQLRHVLYFKDSEGLREHMKKHAEILRPKFETVIEAFDKELAPLGCVEYVKPRGGYFISIDVPGCAKRCVELCKEAGISLTPAGATYPYKNDPEDKNIRIAPSYLDVKDLEKAVRVLCASVKLACVEKFYKK